MNKLWFEIGFFSGAEPRWFGLDFVEGDFTWDVMTILRIQIGIWILSFGLEQA